MAPEDADRVCGDAVRCLLNLRLDVSNSSYAQSFDYQYGAASKCSIAALIPHIGGQKSEKLAYQLAQLMCSEVGVNNESYGLASPRSTNLNLVITRYGQRDKISETIGEGITEDDQEQMGASLPCRLTTQELVDLLKMPTCIGVAHRIMLDHLGNRYSRHFTNTWSFVRFAGEHNLELDFTTRPKRPIPGNRSSECSGFSISRDWASESHCPPSGGTIRLQQTKPSAVPSDSR